jgi:hypothetical protein
MKTALRAAAIVLSIAGLPAFAHAETGPVTRVDIARIKSGLHLRPDQAAYWPAVEAAVRSVARHQGEDRLGHVVSIVLDAGAVRRIAAAARPLISALDFQQLQAANGVVNEMGLGAVVAALR